MTPPDEGPRVKGLRIKLQDIVDGEYTPLRVNGTWIGGKINLYKEIYIIWDIYPIKCMLYWISVDEFLYQNQWGGISLLNTVNLSEKVLMSNTTFVSILKDVVKLLFFYWFLYFLCYS